MIWIVRGSGAGSFSCYVDSEPLKSRGIIVSTWLNKDLEIKELARQEIVRLKLIDASGESFRTDGRPVGDLGISQIAAPVFSNRAANLAAELGCSTCDFIECRFEELDEECYLSISDDLVDIIDVDPSEFRIPEPVPVGLTKLATKRLPKNLPPCFKAPLPAYSTIAGETFVTGAFKSGWEEQNLTGAEFVPAHP